MIVTVSGRTYEACMSPDASAVPAESGWPEPTSTRWGAGYRYFYTVTEAQAQAIEDHLRRQAGLFDAAGDTASLQDARAARQDAAKISHDLEAGGPPQRGRKAPPSPAEALASHLQRHGHATAIRENGLAIAVWAGDQQAGPAAETVWLPDGPNSPGFIWGPAYQYGIELRSDWAKAPTASTQTTDTLAGVARAIHESITYDTQHTATTQGATP